MYSTGLLTHEYFKWAVEVAAKNMIHHEVKRPELYYRPSIEALANKMMEEETGILVFKDGRPVGCLGGVVLPNIYNPNLTVMTELIWYVLPEYRNTRAGSMLLKAYIKLIEEKADEGTLSTLVTSEVHKRSLEKLGFIPGEFAFLYRKD